MKIKSLKLAIKQKKFKMDALGAQITALLHEIDEKEQLLQANKDKREKIAHSNVTRVFDIENALLVLEELKRKDDTILQEIEALEEKIVNLRKELAQLLGEKQALEKLISKINNENASQQTAQENELANENFLRKNTPHIIS
ncbi:hypothetical protein [Nitratiruptor sp. YY09-18]|uniref:hypothetical protein n=1 Tax=Nitratiruptor sp. YY09-18 TaxID=2724901 RepID=UPI0019152729|nr:hypothetical protein [Nitratiruptor sp. YY09-18]BCD68372.1 hypothetical protein NitYY0918_C1287 [Nitratiruptor sp. YY09-18]